jgi:hypothetical protein
MVVWQGITSDGVSVPVQVTEDGKVVSQGQAGEQGPPGPPGEQGPQGPPGEYGPGDDVEFGSIAATSTISSNWPGATGTGEGSAIADSINVKRTPSLPAIVVRDNTNSGDINFKVTGAGNINAAGSTFNGNTQVNGRIDIAAGAKVSRSDTSGGYLSIGNSPTNCYSTHNGSETTFRTYYDGTLQIGGTLNSSTPSLATPNISLNSEGSIFAAGDKCGFTADGELYFTSRGTRYKAVVQGGLIVPEEYTRGMEINERIDQARKPRPTDSVQED